MLAQKRSRSKSKGNDVEPQKKLKLEDFQENTDENLNQKVFLFDQASKVLCKICQKDITKNIKILCSVCIDFVFCIDCLIDEKPHDQKGAYKHDYHVVDNLNFNVFHPDWTAKEELLLLQCIFLKIENYNL